MKFIYTSIAFLFLSTAMSAQAVEIVNGNVSYPYGITVFNGSLSACSANNLYVSDGTYDGTSLVKQINSSTNPSLSGFGILNNKLIFADDNNQTGVLWSSDGTPAGTAPYAAVIAATNFYLGTAFASLNNKLYFGGGDTTGQNLSNVKDQLWVTDGTALGTALVKTINPSGPAAISHMYVYNGNIYFNATDNVNGAQLWISDGSASGTHLLKVINNSAQTSTTTYITTFIPYNGKLYFATSDSAIGSQIWVTDGTTGGTNRVTSSPSNGISMRYPIVFNGKIYFNGLDSTGYRQLWSSDGTAAGTSIVHAERDQAFQSGFAPVYMTIYNGSLYMQGSDSIHKGELWKSDGTANGTQLVTHTPAFFPVQLAVLGNKLVFIADDTLTGTANVFIGDGTEAGSQPYQVQGEYNPDFRNTNGFVPFNNALYFNASYFTTQDYLLAKVVLSTVGINEVGTSKLNIYPNPANAHLYIKSDITMSSILISDISGRVVFSAASFSGNSVNTSTFSPGIYLIQATDDLGQVYISKFVKQ